MDERRDVHLAASGGVRVKVLERRTGMKPAAPAKRGSLTWKLASNASLLRGLSKPLLRFAPVLSVGRVVVVSRYDDVCDVLERDTDFTIAEVNAARMDVISGPFVLGMDRSPQYDRERGILQRCVLAGDPERIASVVDAAAAELIGIARPKGSIDVVQELARPAAIQLVDTYFGVAGPDVPTMMRWMRVLFHEAFLNSGGEADVHRAAARAAAELHSHLDELIARRQSEISNDISTPDDVLTRLVRLQADPQTRLSDEGIRRNISGVIVGAVETTSKAIAHSVDQLLRRPDAWSRVTHAAKADDVDLVGRYVFEALRFNPLNPAVARHVAHDTVIAPGTKRARLVRAGKTVFVAVMPAMLDPAAFDDPDTLRPDRSIALLHFGHGMHRCFGHYVNAIQIPRLVAPLLKLDNLRRATGRPGRITYDGPFPDRFQLAFEPTAGSNQGA